MLCLKRYHAVFLFTTKDNLLIEIHEYSVQYQKMLLGLFHVKKFLKQKTLLFPDKNSQIMYIAQILIF